MIQTPTATTRPFLPFAVPDIGEGEIAEVVDALRSGWITTGPKTKQFEQDFAAYISCGQTVPVQAIAVSSATAGLHLALEALGVGPGDEVIVPTHTFTATAEVVRYLGADVVLVDVDRDTLNMDPAAFERAITPRTKVVIPVHFAGLACDMGRIATIARAHGIKIVEDAAHALPTTWGGQIIGTLESDVTVFSFYATKTLATGEGGMLTTRNAEIAHRCRTMRLHGIDRDAFNRYTSVLPSWKYEVVAPGYKYNLTDLASAIGLHQLRRLPEMQRRRQKIAAQYHEAFASLPLQLPSGALMGDMHAWHLYVIRLTEDGEARRDGFIEEMSRRGIGCSVHFIPLHMQPYWRDEYKLRVEDFPNSTSQFACSVSLPLYTRMSEEDVERVIAETTSVLLDR
jgi:dTDP-4-amino-4,6-dideoxygalactose transaminase